MKLINCFRCGNFCANDEQPCLLCQATDRAGIADGNEVVSITTHAEYQPTPPHIFTKQHFIKVVINIKSDDWRRLFWKMQDIGRKIFEKQYPGLREKLHFEELIEIIISEYCNINNLRVFPGSTVKRYEFQVGRNPEEVHIFINFGADLKSPEQIFTEQMEYFINSL